MLKIFTQLKEYIERIQTKGLDPKFCYVECRLDDIVYYCCTPHSYTSDLDAAIGGLEKAKELINNDEIRKHIADNEFWLYSVDDKAYKRIELPSSYGDVCETEDIYGNINYARDRIRSLARTRRGKCPKPGPQCCVNSQTRQ